MINPENYVEFIIKNDINEKQFLFLYLVYKKKHQLIKSYMTKFPMPDGTMIGKDNIQDLVNKQFITITRIEGKNHITISDKFTGLFVDLNEAVDQLYDLYPAIINTGTKKLPLTLYSREELKKDYALILKTESHFDIIEDLKYAVKYNLIFGKIDMFFKSKFFLGIRKMRLGVSTLDDVKIGQDIEHEYGE